MRVVVWLAALAVGVGLSAAFAAGEETPAIVPPADGPVTTIVKQGAESAAAERAPTEPAETPGPRAETEPPKAAPGPSLVARINLSSQRLEVIEGGATKHSWAISSGREGFPTPRGTFRVQWTAKMWYSRKYDMAPMPNAVFFKDGVAVHATSSTGLLGRPASHGCVRLAPSHAAQFYALVHKHGTARTQVQVFGNPPSAAIAERKTRTPVARLARADTTNPMGLGSGRAGVLHLPQGSPYAGSASFTHNGIRYVRVR